MGNYMSADPPRTKWRVLRREILKLGEDIELELEDGESGRVNFQRCSKDPGHAAMTAFMDFRFDTLPPEWRRLDMFATVANLAFRAVRLSLPYVSAARPKGYALADFRGSWVPSTGSGLAGIDLDSVTQAPINCPIPNCPLPRPHKVTPVFDVCTAKHVIFDNSEAAHAAVEFFYDYEGAVVTTGQILGIETSVRAYDTSVLKCVSHDLQLFHKFILLWIALDVFKLVLHRRGVRPPRSHPPGRIPPLVVLASHPHGHVKHISMGVITGRGTSLHQQLSFSSIKLKDVMAMAKKGSSRKGVELPDYAGEVSPEIIHAWEMLVQVNPNATAADFFLQNPSNNLKFLSYTAATCPGSSGARVCVIEEQGDGSLELKMDSYHSRAVKKRKRGCYVNRSGIVCVYPLGS